MTFTARSTMRGKDLLSEFNLHFPRHGGTNDSLKVSVLLRPILEVATLGEFEIAAVFRKHIEHFRGCTDDTKRTVEITHKERNRKFRVRRILAITAHIQLSLGKMLGHVRRQRAR